MELYQLKTFVAIAKEGSLTRAAERVFTSAPAVSAQLKALEDELGVKLFERTPRGMVLTPAGRSLREEAERTLDSAMRMRSAAEQIRGAAQGVVRFGTVVDPVALRLGDVLVKLAERHPQVTLQLRQGLSYETLAAVQHGELNCAYALSDDEEVDGLELRRLVPVELVVALPAPVSRPGLTLEELTQMPWVGTPPSCILRTHLEKLFAGAGRPYRQGRTADNESAIRSMVASGMGAGLMRLDQAEQGRRNGELAIWEGWRSRTWLCWLAGEGRHAAAVDAVRGAVLEAWA
ncbi:DNA-binding transcriptional LysR family regulator [Variovorax sp. TBS-050B]|uniref:LysR family transcriptional regulator n=1 Tax=Variovorax sp. TBS-050B TaxID=2940551 RepID=UPI0024772AAD|nr:LysR family transcriptional regulator [Variovorax sp. TBS-050B]MDH6592910.1 DNA-binding transcriptional LysR family regulator [Variovorax sp. TBS-050B]